MKPIYVTKPSLPPLEELYPYLNKIWESRVLTNGGQFHKELEKSLCEFLGVKYISLFTNATIALITSLKSLNLSSGDEVITTPFSFVATSHSLLWNDIKPIFVDIDPNTLNINPDKIEASITSKTKAILAVHCYGIPADVEAIQTIAEKYSLKFIYDAAHAFGVQCHCGSILNHGDLSILSFHATKVFNTFEGGAIISHDEQTKILIDELKNFGHAGEINVINTGINGKMSEINAAIGLLQIKHVNKYIKDRGVIDSAYRKQLNGIKGIECLSNSHVKTHNYAYFPILVNSDFPITRDELYDQFKTIGIYTRRYFYPLISDFCMYKDFDSAKQSNLPNAKLASEQVLCLPIYPDLEMSIVEEITLFIASIK